MHTSVALLVRNHQVLVLLRGKTAPWYPSAWNLPGGSCEVDETPLEGAIRECTEEAGISPTALQPLQVVDMGVDGLLHAFVERGDFGDVRICWESEDYRWIGIEEVADLPFVPHVVALIHAALTEVQVAPPLA